jgi:ATP-binding cassette subfamily B protein RaxB
VHDDIVGMPMAYNTLIGDMGAAISGGQKQRVLLARALYRRPGILFLDEATSHLDVDREKAVNDALRKLHVTRIVIAHRPETIRAADRVINLEAGTISQERAGGLRAAGGAGQAPWRPSQLLQRQPRPARVPAIEAAE